MTQTFQQRKAELEKKEDKFRLASNLQPSNVNLFAELIKTRAELKGLQEGYALAQKEIHDKESEAHHKGYNFAKQEDLKTIKEWFMNDKEDKKNYRGWDLAEVEAEISKEGTK